MISAGRVLIVPRGEWNAETTYHMLDLVTCKGRAYLAKRTVVGIDPSNEASDSVYWHNLIDVNQMVEDEVGKAVADEIEKVIAEWDTQLTNLQETTRDHSEQLESINNEVDAHAENIESLQNESDAHSESINKLGWITLGTATKSIEETTKSISGTLNIPIDDELIHELSAIRYVIKKGSTFYGKVDRTNAKTNESSAIYIRLKGASSAQFEFRVKTSNYEVFEHTYTLEKDLIINLSDRTYNEGNYYSSHSGDQFLVENGVLSCEFSVTQTNITSCEYSIIRESDSGVNYEGGFSITIELQGKI